jgi:hypothetical protein
VIDPAFLLIVGELAAILMLADQYRWLGGAKWYLTAYRWREAFHRCCFHDSLGLKDGIALIVRRSLRQLALIVPVRVVLHVVVYFG